MKIAIYVWVLVICGCSAKRKLTESSVVSTAEITELATLNTREQHSKRYSLIVDSADQTNFLKLYPKGDFVISKGGFKGSADSLIWYHTVSQVRKSRQTEQQKQEQSNSQVVKQMVIKNAKENKKELVKVGSYIWYILGGLTVVGCFFAARRMIRKV